MFVVANIEGKDVEVKPGSVLYIPANAVHTGKATPDADVVFFGIDQSEPVIEASALLDSRDLAARPLTVVDFNSFGSIDEDADLDGARLWTAGQLDQAVAAHVAITTTRAGFAIAAEQAETRIARCLDGEPAPDGTRRPRPGRPAEV